MFEDATVMIIEQLHSANSVRRKDRESYWIYTLRTLTSDGLNLELSTIPQQQSTTWADVGLSVTFSVSLGVSFGVYFQCYFDVISGVSF